MAVMREAAPDRVSQSPPDPELWSAFQNPVVKRTSKEAGKDRNDIETHGERCDYHSSLPHASFEDTADYQVASYDHSADSAIWLRSCRLPTIGFIENLGNVLRAKAPTDCRRGLQRPGRVFNETRRHPADVFVGVFKLRCPGETTGQPKPKSSAPSGRASNYKRSCIELRPIRKRLIQQPGICPPRSYAWRCLRIPRPLAGLSVLSPLASSADTLGTPVSKSRLRSHPRFNLRLELQRPRLQRWIQPLTASTTTPDFISNPARPRWTGFRCLLSTSAPASFGSKTP